MDGQYQKPAWPNSVLEFRGDKDWVPFEKAREDLLSPNEDPFGEGVRST